MDVKFSVVRWIIFLLSTAIGAFIGINLIKIRYLAGGVGGGVGGALAYFYFYFKDKRLIPRTR